MTKIVEIVHGLSLAAAMAAAAMALAMAGAAAVTAVATRFDAAAATDVSGRRLGFARVGVSSEPQVGAFRLRLAAR